MAYAVANNAGRIVEVPITFGKRERGASKMSSIIVFEALGMVTWWGIRDRVAPPSPGPSDQPGRCRSRLRHTTGMRDWLVAGALIEGPGGLLLVENRRRNGSVDWSPPGGVIDEGEEVLVGLEREVVEETGLVVTAWSDPVYDIEVFAPDLGWHLRVEAFRALEWSGELRGRRPRRHRDRCPLRGGRRSAASTSAAGTGGWASRWGSGWPTSGTVGVRSATTSRGDDPSTFAITRT